MDELNPTIGNEQMQQSNQISEPADSEETEEELSTEENAEQAHDKVELLVDILEKKGLISRDEFEQEYDNLFEDDDSETE